MANQQNSYDVSDGTGTGNRDFNYTFPSFLESEVKVEIDNVVKTLTTHYTIENHNNTSGGTVRFNTTGLPDGTAGTTPVRIFRQTNVETPKAEFTAGSSLKAQEINDNFKQVRHALQEAIGAATTDRKIQRFNIEADSIDGTLIADDVINSEHYAAGSIDLEHMSANSVDSDQYVDGSIDLIHMSANSVDSDQYVDGSIDRVHLEADIIDSTKLADNAVNSEHYVDGSIDRVHLAADIVDGTKIADDSINSEHYVADSIDTEHYAPSSVDSTALADDAVTTDKIASTAVATGNIATNAVTRGKILDGEVVRSKIEADAIDSTKLADNAVNSEHYVDGSIDLIHMSANSVDSDQYVDGSIDRIHLEADIIDSTKLADNAVNSEHYVDGSIDHVHLANDIIDGDNIQDDVINSEHIAAGAVDLEHMSANSVDSNQYVDGSIDHVHLANDIIDGDNIQDDVINSEHIAAGALDNEHYAAGSITSDKLNGATVVTNSEQAASTPNDTSFFTTAAAEARYFNASTTETIKNGDTFPDNDTTIATTAAINDRIIDLVDDVGGFVPIANELSFPNSNPDVNDGAGTLVSIKSLSQNLTSNGSGVISISNGTVGNSTVTIVGADNSTTYAAGFGLIVETHADANKYTFHRLVPKATEVTTVATNITNVVNAGSNTTNINTVAGQISPTNNISTVAGIATAVSTVATNNSNVTSVANNMANVNNFNDRYQIAANNPSTDGGGNALAAGDLYFNTSANELKVYTGSAWQGGVTATGNFAVVTGNTFTGDNRYNDNVKALFGTGSDLEIFHQGNNARINNTTGYITSNSASGHIFRNTNGSEQLIRADVDGSVDLYYDNSKKFETTSAGVSITGSLYTSSDIFINGAADASSILRFYDGGVDSWILTQDNSTNVLSFRRNSANRLSLAANGDTQIPLDNQKLLIGASQDLEIYHNGTNTVIDNNTGDLYIETTGSGDDIFIQSKDDITIKTANGQNAITAVGGAQIDLYYDNAKRLETTSDGVVFTGAARFVGNETGFLTGKAHPTLYRTASTSGSYPFDNFGNLVIQSRNDGSNRDIIFATGTNSAKLNRITSDGHLDLFGDNQKIRLGASQDLQIYHDGNDSIILNGTGNLVLRNTSGDAGVIGIQPKSGENGIICRDDNNVELYYDNSKKFETTSAGVQVTGNLAFADNGIASFGASGDLQIFHNGSNSLIHDTGTGGVIIAASKTNIMNSAAGENMAVFNNNGAVELYHDNVKTFFTTTNGIQVQGPSGGIGQITLSADANEDNTDKFKLVVEDGGPFRIQNRASATWETNIECNGNNNVELYYDNSEKFRTKSSGVTVTGEAAITSDLVMNTADNQVIYLGAGNDLMMYHSGTHSYIKNKTGNLYLMTTNTEYGAGFSGNGAAELYYDNVKKFETTSAGVLVSGSLTADGGNAITLGDSKKIVLGTGSDLELYHNGSNSYLRNSTGIMHVGGSGGNLLLEALGDVRTVSWEGESMIEAKRNGAVELYYDNSRKFRTHSSGAVFEGNLNGADSNKLTLGAADDLELYHDGSNSYIDNHTGTLYIRGGTGTTIKLQPVDGEDGVIVGHNSTTELFYDNVKRFATTTTGGIFYNGSGTASVRLHGYGSTSGAARFGDILMNQDMTIRTVYSDALIFNTNQTNRAYFDGSTGHFLPHDNNTYDLGSTSQRWRNVYTNDLHLSNEGHTNDVDGSWGDWTIQEGESDLFLKNNRSGKKYKFNLTEVS